MTIINTNSISGINSITAQGASGLEFFDSSGNSVQTVTGDGLTVGTGATISGSTNTITASTNGSERLRITSAGRVNIGQASDVDHTLCVAGTDNATSLTGGHNQGIQLQNKSTTDGTYSQIEWRTAAGGRYARIAGIQDDANGNGGQLAFLTENTSGSTVEVLRITSTGRLILPTGTPGIQFGSTDSGGIVVSQTLDDYEEGAYDPTISFDSSGSATLNTSYNTLSYIKIGRLVTINGQLRIASVSSPVGNMGVSLPFAVTSTTEKGRSGGALFWLDSSAGSGNYYKNMPYTVEESSTTLRVDNLHYNGGVQFAANDEISFAVTYVANA